MALICIAIALGGWLSLFAGLVAGYSIIETMSTIGAITGGFEGIVRGFTTYGVVGAVIGGPLGFVGGMIASLPVTILLLMVLYLGTGTGSETKSE